MRAREEDIFLKLSVGDLIRVNEHVFPDCFYCPEPSLEFGKVDFSKSASAQDCNELKVFKLDILFDGFSFADEHRHAHLVVFFGSYRIKKLLGHFFSFIGFDWDANHRVTRVDKDEIIVVFCRWL